MRLVLLVVFWAFAAGASAQICSGEGEHMIVTGRDGVLDRLAMLTGTVVALDEGERTDDFDIDDTPPCGPCMEEADARVLSGTYHSYLFQYFAAADAPADVSFVVANDAQAVILEGDRLFDSDDPVLIPALLRTALDRTIEGGDVVTVSGRMITLHFDASALRGLDHVRVLTLPGGDCSPMIPDAGGHDAGSISLSDGGGGSIDGAVTRNDASAENDASIGRRDGGSSFDSGSRTRGRSYQFEGGGGCACRASGDATLAPLLALFLFARSRRRDSR